MNWDESLKLSDDCKTWSSHPPTDPVNLSAGQVEELIRLLSTRRFLMEPAPAKDAPMPPVGPECLLTGLAAIPSNEGNRVGLHLCTRQFGWLLFSMPLGLAPMFVKDVMSAAIAAGVLVKPQQGKPANETAQ